MKFPILLSLFGLFLLTSCTSSRVIRPLEKKQTAFGADVSLLSTSPTAPIINIQLAHGLSKSTTFYSGINFSSIFTGVFMADLGFLYGLWHPKAWRPGCSISPRISGHFSSHYSVLTAIQPEADLNLYWEYLNREKSAKNFLFLNIRNWFEVEKGRKFLPNGYRPIISFGHRWQTEKMQLGVEARYMHGNFDAANYDVGNANNTLGMMFTVVRLF
ncbi:hypothetical protein PPO43_11675 [Saprospira sp. CCB-QB6]|uniref:hypothetical protein n=1 Tax=Saprospira sp. CCB-QB6 TaxID=3023936 RepID=UPI00234BD898|nr:hypothetical protein [Saprospira sp. CCB-QB6]WCL80628.1 hypothetical protein PPO43_11675 [Saprospira sp. CCB-QB6]